MACRLEDGRAQAAISKAKHRSHQRSLRSYVRDQWPFSGGAFGGMTLRSSGTSAVAMMKATMIARNASAKASVAASR